MIYIAMPEAKKVALIFAELLGDTKSMALLEQDEAYTHEDASHLSRFYWNMVDLGIVFDKHELSFPFEGSAQYWIEQLVHAFVSFMKSNGFEKEWEQAYPKD